MPGTESPHTSRDQPQFNKKIQQKSILRKFIISLLRFRETRAAEEELLQLEKENATLQSMMKHKVSLRFFQICKPPQACCSGGGLLRKIWSSPNECL